MAGHCRNNEAKSRFRASVFSALVLITTLLKRRYVLSVKDKNEDTVKVTDI
jgi:hypothetical protein